MKPGLLAVRASILWILSGIHFFVCAPLLVFLGVFLDPRRHDWLQRSFCRRIVFLSGAGEAESRFRRASSANSRPTSRAMPC